jgi:autotransporter-associated beta strand protein
MTRPHPAKPRIPLRRCSRAITLLGLSLIALLSLFSSLRAQTTYSWDANGGGGGTGGSGSWSSGGTATNWTADGSTYVVWTSITNSSGVTDQSEAIASFGGTAGTVTVANSYTADGLAFSTSGYVLTRTASNNRTLTLASGNVTVDALVEATITGNVAIGGGNLTKLGSGTLTIGNANASYTGTATISAGTVVYGTNQALRNTSLVVESDATLNLAVFAHTVGATGSTLTGSGTITGASSSVLAYESTTSSDFSGVLSGGLRLAKSGGDSSTLTLSGSSANSYTGDTFVSLGTLTLNKTAGVDAVPGNLIIGDGTSTDTVSLSAANQIADTSVVTMSNSGKFNLNGHAETIGALSGNASGADIDLGGGALTVSGTSDSSFAGSVETGTGGVLTFGGAANALMSGVISEAGSVVKTGTGTLTLSGANTYTGATTIGGGSLRINGNARLGNTASSITLSNAGTLEVTAAGALTNAITIGAGNGVLSNSSAGALVIAGAVSKDGTVFTSRSGSGTNVFTGVISGASANSDFIVDGGTTVFSNVMTYNGPTIITNDGTLVLGTNNATPATSGLVLGGGTLLIGDATTRYSTTFASLTLTEDSTIDMGANGGLGTLTFGDSSSISWNGTLTITNWQGVAATQSDVTKLLFGVGGLDSDQRAQIQFAGYEQGSLLIDGELAPIPEAPVVWGAAAVAAFIIWRERRRLLDLLRSLRPPTV